MLSKERDDNSLSVRMESVFGTLELQCALLHNRALCTISVMDYHGRFVHQEVLVVCGIVRDCSRIVHVVAKGYMDGIAYLL